jgi:hypothetical protein
MTIQNGGGFPPQYRADPVPVYMAQPEPRGLSVASMVLGIVSIFFGFTFVIPLTGLILGLVGVKREPAGRGMAVTGIILSGLMLLGWVVLIVFVVGLGVFGIAGVAGTSVSY